MDSISFASTSRKTSCLGFGCGTSDDSGVLLLEAAFDAGIRHFDVARSYAHGTSERYLGKFLKTKRHADITVTTKYGILPPSRHLLFSIVHRPLRPLLRKMRRLPYLDRQVGRSVAALYAKAKFTAAEADASLRQSMHELGIEHVDLFLMHEATANDLQNEQLLKFLEDSVKSGRIGSFGVGGEASHIPQLLQSCPEFCRTLQFEWSILDPRCDYGDSFRIHFRTFARLAPILQLALSKRPEMCRQWCDVLDADIMDTDQLAALLLKSALIAVPNSMVLFTSKSSEHIYRNARVANDISLVRKAHRLISLLEAEPNLTTTY